MDWGYSASSQKAYECPLQKAYNFVRKGSDGNRIDRCGGGHGEKDSSGTK